MNEGLPLHNHVLALETFAHESDAQAVFSHRGIGMGNNARVVQRSICTEFPTDRCQAYLSAIGEMIIAFVFRRLD